MRTIFHLIDSLKRGGAETLLCHVVTNLKDYDNYVITLTDEIDFSPFEIQGLRHISLGFNSLFSLPLSVLKLKKLIAQHKPAIVHAHLPLTSLVARLSVPSKIKLFISIHNNFSDSFKKVSPRLFFLEKNLHSKREKLLFVSSAIKEDYDHIIGIKGSSNVLYNFIADKYFAEENQLIQSPGIKEKFRLVSVGSLKKQKNFDTLIKAFGLLDASKFSLDIFGEGPERKSLENLINQLQLTNVNLRGAIPNVEIHLKKYDAYILASSYEGFGIAPLEAAAIGLPLLLSDIDVFKEVTQGYASFFSPHDEKNIADKILSLEVHYEVAYRQAQVFKSIVYKKYSREIYLDKLLKIYQS